MKLTFLVAILLLSLFIIPAAVALQQANQTPKAVLSRPESSFSLDVCSNSLKSTEPGSGGGGQGVI